MNILERIIANVEQVIEGKRNVIELAVITLLAGGHLLIEDVPGVGKTSLAQALARSLDCSFNRIQFTPDIMPADITGFSVYNPKTSTFEYRKGAIFSQIVLADEINRTLPKTQSSLLEAMEEKQVTVDNTTYRLEEPFMVIATQNPVDYLGTYPLPEAQMDRFFMQVSMGYPKAEQEARMLLDLYRGKKEQVQPVVSAADILKLRAIVAETYVEPTIAGYIVSIVQATRNHPLVELGASPRGSIALYKAAQAWAIYQGRNFVVPDDVVAMSTPTLAHRLLLRAQANLNGTTQQEVIQGVVAQVPVPIARK